MSEALKTKQIPEIDYKVAEFDDTTTWLAEAVDGRMLTSFNYYFDGGEIYSKSDGRPMSKVFYDALATAEETTRWQPKLSFEVRRRKHDLAEYKDMIDMAKNPSGPNTMVVVSDFPSELKQADKDIGGYNTNRQQTMLRVINRNEDGTLTMYSQSLDRSDRESLEALYEFLGFEPEPGELLGQRMHLNIDKKFQDSLVDNLVSVYDNALTQKYGGQWVAGRRQPNNNHNTYDFVLEQYDMINAYLLGPRDEKANYDLVASIQARFDGTNPVSATVYPNNLRFISVAVEMEHYGRMARAEGKTFSGCGVSVAGSLEEEMSMLGYGDSDKKNDQDCEFVSKSCPECGTKNVKTKVTKTHTSGSCGCKVKNS